MSPIYADLHMISKRRLKSLHPCTRSLITMTHLKCQILDSALLASYFVERVSPPWKPHWVRNFYMPPIARFPFTLLYLRRLRNFDSCRAFELTVCLLANKQTQENARGVGCQPIIIALPAFVQINECQRHSLANLFINMLQQQRTDRCFHLIIFRSIRMRYFWPTVVY